MKLAELADWLLASPGLRPLWWRWLQTAPELVRVAEQRVRASYLFIQMPGTLLLMGVLGIGQHLGVFKAVPLAGAWIAGVAVILMAWPLPLLRLGGAAKRTAATASGRMRSQLRAFAVLAYAVAALASVVIAAIVALLIFASWPT